LRSATAIGHVPGVVATAGVVLMMLRMTPPNPPRRRRAEQLITALVPVRLGGDGPPTPVPLPMLPAPGLPAGAVPGDLVVESARLDASGRLTARALLRALGWDPGHRVDIAVTEGVVVVGSAPAGLHVVGDRGEVGLPVTARRMCGITRGLPVLLVAVLPRDVLVVHPAHLIGQLLADWYTTRAGESGAC
jgi:bifunctional DNA-binding transcriptional regulator/antitoxin component of YhaV-PrlF toxin-antitoxin module